MVITKILKGKEDINLIFVDGKYLCSIDDETLLKNNLYVDRDISQELIDELKKSFDKYKLKKKAYDLLSYRSHSKKELIDKVSRRHGISADLVNEVVNKIENAGIIDDRKFAKEYSLSLFKKYYSIKRVVFELNKKGINRDIINDIINEIAPNEVNQIVGLIKKKYVKKINAKNGKNKVFLSLKNMGYGSSDIKKGITIFEEELSKESDID